MRVGTNVERGTGRDRRTADVDDRSSTGPLGRFEDEVDRAGALVCEAIGRLTRHYPEHAIRGAASDDLRRMKSDFLGALAALAEIEQRRRLTHEELAHRRAFKMLLEGVRVGH
jgi:hypothetical protein